jgi:hypothetical protein
VAKQHERHPHRPGKEHEAEAQPARCGEEHQADEQRIGCVERGHRRVLVRQPAHDPAVHVEPFVATQRVDEAVLREEPRWRERIGDVDDQARRVRQDEGVPKAGVELVPPQVDPDECGEDDHELGQPVRPVGEVEDHSGSPEHDPLQTRLDEEV